MRTTTFADGSESLCDAVQLLASLSGWQLEVLPAALPGRRRMAQVVTAPAPRQPAHALVVRAPVMHALVVRVLVVRSLSIDSL